MKNIEVIEKLKNGEVVFLTKTNLKNEEVKEAILNFANEDEKKIFLKKVICGYERGLSYEKEAILKELYNYDKEYFILKTINIIRKDRQLLLEAILNTHLFDFELKRKIFDKELTIENIVREIKGLEDKVYYFLENNLFYLRNIEEIKIADDKLIKLIYEIFDKDLTILQILKKYFSKIKRNDTEFVLKSVKMENDTKTVLTLKSINNVLKMNDINALINKMDLISEYDFYIYDYINDVQIIAFKRALEILKNELSENNYKKIILNIFTKNKFLFNSLDKDSCIFEVKEIQEMIEILLPVIKENEIESIDIEFIKKHLFELSILDNEITNKYNKLLIKYKKATAIIYKKDEKILFDKIRNREKIEFETIKNYKLDNIIREDKEEFKEIIQILNDEYGENGCILINNLFTLKLIEIMDVPTKLKQKIIKINEIQNKLFNK